MLWDVRNGKNGGINSDVGGALVKPEKGFRLPVFPSFWATSPGFWAGLDQMQMHDFASTLRKMSPFWRHGAPAAVALGVLALLALAPPAAADSTAFATTLALSGKDPAGCGQLDRPCCLARGRSGGLRCSGANLACLPRDGAQALRCHACGGESQPACEGGDGLLAGRILTRAPRRACPPV
jgi:hypothetical protein